MSPGKPPATHVSSSKSPHRRPRARCSSASAVPHSANLPQTPPSSPTFGDNRWRDCASPSPAIPQNRQHPARYAPAAWPAQIRPAANPPRPLPAPAPAKSHAPSSRTAHKADRKPRGPRPAPPTPERPRRSLQERARRLPSLVSSPSRTQRHFPRHIPRSSSAPSQSSRRRFQSSVNSSQFSRTCDTPIPDVFVRVARKELTQHRVRKSGKQRTYREAFLHFRATDEFPKGYATPGVLQKEFAS